MTVSERHATVSAVVVPDASVQISRNVDFDFLNPENCSEPAYRISKPVSADAELSAGLLKALKDRKPLTATSPILGGTTNASADSFYSSQGRVTSFPDHNSDLVTHLQGAVPNLSTLEMETFHLYHLAACWGARSSAAVSENNPPPLATRPVHPVIASPEKSSHQVESDPPLATGQTVIKAAAAHMVFASRTSRDFITPQGVDELERWTGQAVLDALIGIAIPNDRVHEDEGSVWEI